MDLDSLKRELIIRLRGNVKRTSSTPEGALTHHPINRAVVSPTGSCALPRAFPLLQATSKGGASMAIYHMQAKVVSRGSGRSAVAASAI